MAMNKREKAEFNRLAILAALRWTPKIMPDIPVPTEGHTQGWAINVYLAANGQLSGSIRPAWSRPCMHGAGQHSPPGRHSIGSQGGIELYSTELLAAKSLRHGLESLYAENLKRLDDRIKALEAEDGS